MIPMNCPYNTAAAQQTFGQTRAAATENRRIPRGKEPAVRNPSSHANNVAGRPVIRPAVGDAPAVREALLRCPKKHYCRQMGEYVTEEDLKIVTVVFTECDQTEAHGRRMRCCMSGLPEFIPPRSSPSTGSNLPGHATPFPAAAHAFV